MTNEPKEIITIYDELDCPYVCEAEVGGTRVMRVISGPTFEDHTSLSSKHCESGYMNDMRFGG